MLCFLFTVMVSLFFCPIYVVSAELFLSHLKDIKLRTAMKHEEDV